MFGVRLARDPREGEVGLRPEVLIHPFGDRHATRWGVALHPNRHVDAAAEQVVAADQHVGQHDTGADAQDLLRQRLQPPLVKLALQRGRPLHGSDDALELGKQAIAHGLEDLAALFADRLVDQHLIDRAHKPKCLCLAVVDEPGIADDVERYDRHQFSIGLRHACADLGRPVHCSSFAPKTRCASNTGVISAARQSIAMRSIDQRRGQEPRVRTEISIDWPALTSNGRV